MKEPLILLIETSGDVCSVALAKGDCACAELTQLEKNSHSKLLAPLVAELLSANSCEVNELDAIAISGGPGSYTGLRIGASFAKGMCYAQNKPMISVSSLAAIACAMKEYAGDHKHYIPIIDARREDAYVAHYDAELKLVGAEQFMTLEKGYLSELEGSVLLGGSGASKAAAFTDRKLIEVCQCQLEARHLAQLAYQKFQNKAFEDLAYYEPNYIKSVHISSPKKSRLNR